jgi:hypothetical protein
VVSVIWCMRLLYVTLGSVAVNLLSTLNGHHRVTTTFFRV